MKNSRKGCENKITHQMNPYIDKKRYRTTMLKGDAMLPKIKMFVVSLATVVLTICSADIQAGDVEQTAAKNLIQRVLPEHAARFTVEIIPADKSNAKDGERDVFEIEGGGDRVTLRGNNPISVASALNWYLKNYAKCQFSWCGDQLNVPTPLPKVAGKVRIVNPHKYRVYFNYCTLSYTATWWDWNRWQREIDFMALNGINMPLGVTGIEGAWYNTLLRLGFTDAEAREFLAGPCYQAWQWMQNLERYGGPLPKSWIDSHIKLGRQILDRERELGMTPIQQGFSGAVPRRLKDKYPNAAMKQQGTWGGSFHGVMQLDPLDPLFAKMGKIFLKEQEKLFGTSHFYGCDPFHEGAPPKPGDEYLGDVGRAISRLLVDHDPKATWCMQSWSIRKPIATAVPKDRLLVLDISGGRWRTTDSFWGYPFVTGLIHNFGGRTRMCGDLPALAKNPFADVAKKSPDCRGMGLFPEAIEHNPVFYDLAFDLIWRDKGVDVKQWLHDYARRRYGVESASAGEAWAILLNTVYRYGDIYSSPFAARPALILKMADPNMPIGMPYDPAKIVRAWELLLADSEKLKSSAGYRYDVVDLGRQILADLAQPMHWAAADAFVDRDAKRFSEASKQFLDLFADADKLCVTQPQLSFRRWYRASQTWATSPEERTLYTFNANMLLTHWGGDTPPPIFNYSWREWGGGLLSDFYRGRWAIFHAMLADRLTKNQMWSEGRLKMVYGKPELKANEFYSKLYDWEMDWIRAEKQYDSDSLGDSIAVAREMYEKYKPVATKLFSKEGRTLWGKQKNRVTEAFLAADLGKRVWHWKPDNAKANWHEVSIDVTGQLGMSSDFELRFQRNAGGELQIKKIVVEQDGSPVAKDEHSGVTGRKAMDLHDKNIYRFHLPMAVPNATYVIKATIQSDPSAKSVGTVWLREK